MIIDDTDEFDGEICQESPSFYRVVYQGSTVFISKDQLTTVDRASALPTDSRLFFEGAEIINESKAIFTNPGTSAPSSEYLVPIYWGRKGVAGPKVTAVIDDLTVTGDFHTDLETVLATVINMNLTYGGDTHQQIESIENGYTKCCGATWLIAQLLNETCIEYRFVLRHETTTPDQYNYKNAGHIYLEIKTPDDTWNVIESCEVLTTPSGSRPQLEDVLWGALNKIAQSTSVDIDTNEAHNYRVLLKSVGFRSGQISTERAEKVVLNQY